MQNMLSDASHIPSVHAFVCSCIHVVGQFFVPLHLCSIRRSSIPFICLYLLMCCLFSSVCVIVCARCFFMSSRSFMMIGHHRFGRTLAPDAENQLAFSAENRLAPDASLLTSTTCTTSTTRTKSTAFSTSTTQKH
jgi:hypothetical protein